VGQIWGWIRCHPIAGRYPFATAGKASAIPHLLISGRCFSRPRRMLGNMMALESTPDVAPRSVSPRERRMRATSTVRVRVDPQLLWSSALKPLSRCR
jgi:hypothetical protein